MRILLTTGEHYCDTPGGAQRIAFDEAVELRSRGDEVWMLARGEPSLPEHEERDGIHLLRYVPEEVAPYNPARKDVHGRAATAVLRRRLPRVDAIHGHIQLSYVAALECYEESVHCCYTIHSPASMEMAIVWRSSGFLRRVTAPLGLRMINRLEAECLRRSNVVTALSAYTIECIRNIHGWELAKSIRTIPGWVDTSRFVPIQDRNSGKEQLGWPRDVPILFTVRRLEPRMGLDRLLEAAHRLVGKGFKFRLMIGGSGTLRGKLEELICNFGLNETVTLLGRISDQDLPLAYAACDAFVLPTTDLECFGLIALEALSAGRPVLATPVGAIPEIIRQFDSSWLAKSATATDIAGLLQQYLEGKIPDHTPCNLHDQTHRSYSRERVLSEFIDATVGSGHFLPSPAPESPFQNAGEGSSTSSASSPD